MKITSHRIAVGIFICLTFAARLLSQNPVAKGRVIDASTKVPLEGAFVAQKGQRKGVYTNAEGRFELGIVGTNPILNIQYLGYRNYTRGLTGNSAADTLFAMVAEDVELPTTVISSERAQTVYPENKTSLVDYDFLGDKLLMIIYDSDRRHNVFELFSKELNYIVAADDVFDPPSALMTDCLGNVHAISDEFASQVDFDGEGLILQKDSIGAFNNLVVPCRGCLGDMVLYENMPSRYSKIFWAIHASDHQKQILYKTVDSYAVRTVRDEKRMIYVPPLPGDGTDWAYWRANGTSRLKNQQDMDLYYLDAVAFPPSFVPMAVIGDHLYIFDHPKLKILCFDSQGKQVSSIAITYPKLRQWRRQILVDHEKENAFAVTERGGFATLHRIDLQTGQLTDAWELPFQFTENIKVAGHYIYFMYRDPLQSSITRLYRIPM